MLQNVLLEHSAILLICIKQLSVFWSSFEWPLKRGFTEVTFKESESPHLTALTGCSEICFMFINVPHFQDFRSKETVVTRGPFLHNTSYVVRNV